MGALETCTHLAPIKRPLPTARQIPMMLNVELLPSERPCPPEALALTLSETADTVDDTADVAVADAESAMVVREGTREDVDVVDDRADQIADG
jgi:hypothetical protein